MKILWITNIVFPEAERLLTESESLKTSGGWLFGMADVLLEYGSGVSLTVATVSPKVKKLTKLRGERITYYLLPYGKGNLRRNPEYEPFWKKVKEEVLPDVVHIHGTEFSHGLAYVNACGADNVVLSIQGMTSACSYYYCHGLKFWEIVSHFTFKDVVRGGIFSGRRLFRTRGEFENELIGKVRHVIGRTSWDKARTWAVNPDAKYHFCGEVLRNEFYDGSIWNRDECDKHTVFVSQADYPIKGFHQLLRAMPLVLRHYPDAKIRVAGCDFMAHGNLRERLRFSGYANIIASLIKKLHLKVECTGKLTAEEMKREYLRCNVFVCPSAIENSPNSLGEAQILGVPVVASYVGGVPDMMKGDEEHLYRFEEVEMLAEKICEIFAGKTDTERMRQAAMRRHDGKNVADTLMKIYGICSQKF